MALSKTNNAFASSLCQVLLQTSVSGNFVFSPFIIFIGLGMLRLGARGITKDEIFTIMKSGKKSADKIWRGYRNVIREHQIKSEAFTLLSANLICCQIGRNPDPSYLHGLKKNFGGDFMRLDFLKCTESALEINNWMKKATKGKIKHVVNADAFNDSTGLVLVNAIYFKGVWKTMFYYGATRKATFHVNHSKQVEVDMMVVSKKFRYGKLRELDAQAVVLPYKGRRFSMIVILPNEYGGLAKILGRIGRFLQKERSLVGSKLWKRSSDVYLELPRFKIEATMGNLVGVLQILGLKHSFDKDVADFGEITDPLGPNPNLYVSDVIQKVIIEVDEKGSKASVATYESESEYSCFASCPRFIPFCVDHPFYFQIVDHAYHDLLLFAGHCSDPTRR